MARKILSKSKKLKVRTDRAKGMKLKEIAKKHKLTMNQVSYILYQTQAAYEPTIIHVDQFNNKAQKHEAQAQPSLWPQTRPSLWERIKRWFS